ncbi:transcriptional regulator [Mesobaculum littorinae]|uniref:Transcriptional regulator n=1 Tax=Mesobaculum littorinae TaxID=2486419 RepID=A0A438AFT1_9RHOB|nr:helix-turn-helix transcriptional regulator [Mesobaculum littorinae]RVV97573.1 transcriptional regulator [Mesobaculum littorinae]
MDINTASQGFAALGQSTRLDVLRLLVKAGPEGLSAGRIGELLGVRQNTLSANLTVLRTAGLVRNERHGRSIRYYADFDGISTLLRFLLQDCCGGEPALCQPLLDDIRCAC